MALRTYLTGIADAIREKKGTTDPINAQDFASEISSISTGGGGTGDNLWDQIMTVQIPTIGAKFSYWFAYWKIEDFTPYIQNYNTEPMEYFDNMFLQSKVRHAPYFNTSNARDMSYMFFSCDLLETVPLYDTSKVTDFTGMFNGCWNLANLPQLNTSSATKMTGMFEECRMLKSIKLNTDANTSMKDFARESYQLESVDLSSTDSLSSTSNGFYNSFRDCYSLKKLIIRNMTKVPPIRDVTSTTYNPFLNCYHFYGTVDATYNPDGLQDGRIYVPDAMVDTLKAATNWSTFADIIVPLSTLVED